MSARGGEDGARGSNEKAEDPGEEIQVFQDGEVGAGASPRVIPTTTRQSQHARAGHVVDQVMPPIP